MTKVQAVRPTTRGSVIGVGLGRFRFVGSGVALLAAVLCAPSVLAGPTGANVVAGQASVTQHGNRTVIRASNGAIINYNSFNVNANESVKFIQPGSTARVLNRITSADPSMINGRITSNGIVYFANPAGVIFGPNSVLNVGGIYAAAGNISNSDFMRGLNRFTDVHGVVENHGRIDAGATAVLIGERVLNSGTISAPAGVVAMVAGNEVTLSERGGTISVRIDAGAMTGQAGAAIENTGAVQAERGSALMVAGDMYSLAVNTTGTVRAKSITVEGRGNAGVQVSGTLDASNQRGNGKGGSISVTGRTVDLVGATLDASGRREGGSVRVGGDYQGTGDMARATSTSVDAASRISADATESGNGGSVVVWSDHTTTFYGAASASGGLAGGDGGFIETSGKINLDIRGASVQAHAGAGGGKGGLWLMDPVNVNIDDPTAGDDTVGGTFGGGVFDPDNSASPAIVDVNTINAALDAGTNVTILTGSVGTDDGNITVSAAVSKTMGTDATLTLRAANNIDVNATIGSTSGALNVDLQANSSGLGNDDLNVASGNVTLNAAITTNGGTFDSSGVGYTQTGSGAITTAGGNVTLTHTGNVGLDGTIDAGTGSFASSGVGFTQASTGSITAVGATLTHTGNVAVDGTVNAGTGAFASSGVGFSQASTGSVTAVGATITHTGNVAADGSIDAGTGAFASSGVDFAEGSTGSITSVGATITHTGDVAINGAINAGAAAFTSTGDGFTIGGTGSVTCDGATITHTGTVALNGTLDAGTGVLDVTGGAGGIAGTGPVTSGAATMNSGGGVTLSDLRASGPLTLTTVGAVDIINDQAITIANSSSIGGNLTLRALAGNIDVQATSVAGTDVRLRTDGTDATIATAALAGIKNFNLTTTGTMGDATIASTGLMGVAANVGGTLRFTGGAGVTIASVPTLRLGDSSAVGFVTITAPDLDITGNVFAGAAGFILQPAADAATIGLNSSGSSFTLTTAELLMLHTTGTVTIGRATGTAGISIGGNGAVDLSTAGYNLSLRGGPALFGDTLTLADDTLLSLLTAGVAGQGTGTDVVIGGTNGRLLIDSADTADLASQVRNVAARTSAGTISVANTGDLNVTTIGAIAGVTGASGMDVTIGATGDLTITDAVASTGAGHVTLNSTGGSVLFASGSSASTGLAGVVTVSAANDIAAPADLTPTITAGAVGLTATTGNIGGASTLRIDTQTLVALSGGNVDVTNVGTGTLDATIAGSGTSLVSLTHAGLLSIASGHSVTGASIRLAAQDLDLQGTINSGNFVTLTRDTDGTIGVGSATGDLTIDSAELARITAATLIIGGSTATEITSTNVSATDLATVSSVRLEALADGGDITFTGSPNVYKGLTARADDSIRVVSDLTVASGGLTLLADADGMADADGDKITIADAAVLSTSSPSGGDITLTASGGIEGVGAVLIDSNAGLRVNNTITAGTTLTLRATGGITLNGAGSGAGVMLTANDGITINNDLSSGTNPLIINADADANGTGLFAVGSSGQIHTTNVNVTITAADAQIDGIIDAGTGTVAISRATSGTIGLGSAAGDLQLSGAEIANIHAISLALGNALTTSINVDGVSASDTSHITGLITFLADDVDIAGAFNTGNADLAIGRGTVGDISLGDAINGLNLTKAELALITSRNVQFGGGVTRNVFVNNVESADTANMSGTITMLADNSVQFIAAPSTFKALTVRARNGIRVNTNLTTTVGNMDLDADTNNASDGTDDVSDAIVIASGRTLDSAGSLLMRAAGGGITGNGSLTLLANSGVSLFHNLTTSGGTTIDADRNADGAGDLLLSSGRTISTSGNNLSISTADLTLDGSINAAQGAVTITRSGAGTIGMGLATGDMTITGSELGRIFAQGLTIGGAAVTGMTIDGITTTNSNGIAGTTSLVAGSGGITFSGVGSTFNALDARASGAVLVAAVLATDAGRLRLESDTDHTGDERITLSVNVTADIPPSSGNPTVAFNIEFASDVFLGGNVVITGRDVMFRGKIDSADSTARQLTVNTFQNAVTTFRGDIGTVNRLFQLATNNDGITQLGSTIKTSGAIGFSNAVRLIGDTTIDVEAGQGVLFNSTVDTALQASGPHSLTILMARGTAPAAVNFPLISFSGNVGSLRPLNNLWLNYDGTTMGNGRENVPAIATIFARPRDNTGAIQTNPTTPYSVAFTTAGEFRMGQNEKFTSGGALTINAGSAILGDVNAVENLRVNSPSITILRREAGKISGQTGINALDQGVDIVSGGTLDFTSTPTVAGSGGEPRFATPGGGGDVAGTLSGFIFQAFGALDPDLINGSGGSVFRTLDLRAQGPTNTNIASTIAGAIPRETRQNDVGQSTTLAQAQFEQVKQLGIVPRNATAGELVELLTGSATYDDYPRALLPAAEDYTTVVNRLPSDRVEALLASYDAVFNTVQVGDDGKPVLDEQGKTRRVSRTQEIQESLLASVKRFREASSVKTPEVDPTAFRAFLEQSPEEAASLGYIRQLGEFLDQLELVGLTARELQQSKAIILNPVRPRGIRNVQQFEAVIRANPTRVMK